jgi:aldehyde dehydrogenase (NAD+)
MYMNGKWIEPKNREYFETINPANSQVLARFPLCTKDDVSSAVDAAVKAFPAWKDTPPPLRAEVLLEAALIMRGRKNELGTLLTSEMGKIISEGKGEVQEAIDFMEYMYGEGRRLLGETTTSELRNKFCMWVRMPKGVVGCITPWNFPMAIPIWKVAAALICGNTIVFKPASYTPLCVAKLVEIFEEAGLPPGVLNLVTGSGGVVGDAIVEHPKVAHISFTGGSDAGRVIYSKAAKKLASCECELGGKNPIIIMDDANLELALPGVLFGAYGTAGQRCTATSRLIVHEKVYKEFMDMLVPRIEKLKVGDPLDPKIDVGPVVSAEQKKSILQYIAIGKKEAKLTIGGKALDSGIYAKGNFIEPTLFESKHGTRISKEEIFGPVLSVIKVRNYAEAAKVANDVEYGLSSSIYTRNVNTAFAAIRDLEAGITYINAPTIGAEVHLPFGGVKNTGNGGREAGTVAVEEFSEIKSVYIDYSDRLQKAQIDRD